MIHKISIKGIIFQEVTNIYIFRSNESFVKIPDDRSLIVYDYTPGEKMPYGRAIVSWQFQEDLVLSKFRILGCNIEGVALWVLQISIVIHSISLSNFVFSSCCWLTCLLNIFTMQKNLLLDIKIGGSYNLLDPKLPWLVIGEVLFLEVSKVFFWLGGPYGGGGIF